MRDFYRGAAKFLGGALLILGVTAAILYFFFVKIVEVNHNAMAPTIMSGDTVVVWETQSLDLGDVALCPNPRVPGGFIMGRVVGRSGQVVMVDGSGHLAINGQVPDRDLHGVIQWDDIETGRHEEVQWADEVLLDHDYRYFWKQGRRRGAYAGRRVSGGFFLLSDNRLYTGADSRELGPVSPATCVGVVVLRLIAGPSPDEIGNAALDRIE